MRNLSRRENGRDSFLLSAAADGMIGAGGRRTLLGEKCRIKERGLFFRAGSYIKESEGWAGRRTEEHFEGNITAD